MARIPHFGGSGLGISTVGVAFGSDDQQKAPFWALSRYQVEFINLNKY